MEYYGIEMAGPFITERVAVLPTWTTSDKARFIYDASSGITYVGGDAGWEALTVTSALLGAAGFQTEAAAEETLALVHSGWVDKGRTDISGMTSIAEGLSVKTAPGSSDDNLLWLDVRTATAPMAGCPKALVYGKLIDLIKVVSGSDWTFPIQLDTAPTTGTRQDLVFLEVWLAEVPTTAPEFYPYGNVEYDENDNGDYDEHKVSNPADPSVAGTIGFLPNGNYFQVRYRVRVTNGPTDIDWLNPTGATPFGLGHADVEAQGSTGAPVSGKTYERAGGISGDLGLWRAGTGTSADKGGNGVDTADGFVYAVPLCGVHRRNQDEWNLNNPNGTAANANPGAGSIANGVSDNGRPDGLYYDQVAPRDVVDFRHRTLPTVDHAHLLGRCLNKILTGDFVVDWAQDGNGIQDFGGGATFNPNNIWGTKLLQVSGLGSNASGVFGGPHSTGMFIEESPNGEPALPDNVRRSWYDLAHDIPAVAWCIQGDASSEHPDNFLSYEPGTRTLTLDTASLSGNPTIKNTTPDVRWFNVASGLTDVVTVGAWSGLGSGTASVIIDGTDHAAHPGPDWHIIILCELEYPQGGGLKDVMEKIVKVEDGANAWSWIEETLSSFTRVNTIQDASATTIRLDAGASSTPGAYVGEWITIITSPTAAGESRLILAYDEITKTVTITGPNLSPAPATGDKYSISPLEPDVSYVRIHRKLRGFSDIYKRIRIATTGNGTVKAPGYVLFTSEGTANGMIVSGATASSYIDIVYCPPLADTNILRVWYDYSPQIEQFIDYSHTVTILEAGWLVSSTDGTANQADAYYHPFSECIPVVDDQRVIGHATPAETNVGPVLFIGHDGDYPLPGLSINPSAMTNLGGYLQPKVNVTPGEGVAALFSLVRSEDGRVWLLLASNRNGDFEVLSADRLFLAPVLERALVRA